MCNRWSTWTKTITDFIENATRTDAEPRKESIVHVVSWINSIYCTTVPFKLILYPVINLAQNAINFREQLFLSRWLEVQLLNIYSTITHNRLTQRFLSHQRSQPQIALHNYNESAIIHILLTWINLIAFSCKFQIIIKNTTIKFWFRIWQF